MRLLIIRFLKFALLLGIGLGLILFSSFWQHSQAAEEFTNASLQGQYSIITLGQGGQFPQAGVSVSNYDGKGKFSGITIQNLPGTSEGERRLVSFPFEGTYNLNPDGTGTGTITNTLPDGTKTNNINIALMITKAEKERKKIQAAEFVILHEPLSEATGSLMTLRGTKIPSEGKFTNASLKGNYAYTINGQGGRVPQSGLGIMIYDGKGTFTGNATVNLPTEIEGQRQLVSAPFVRPYTINSNGTGTATPPGESDILFIITKAKVVDDIKMGEEVFFIVNQLNSLTGNLLTGFITKLAD